MKIINNHVELLRYYNFDQIILDIAANAAVSHKSLEKSCLQEARDFVRRLCKVGHYSVLEIANISFRITTDRSILAQITRHRHLSFCVESQRYNKYDELTFIAPVRIKDNHPAYNIWHKSVKQSAEAYIKLLSNKVPPEIARLVLPNSTAVSMVVTGNLRAWKDYLKLRMEVHTQQEHRLIANKIYIILNNYLPEIF